jgi:hypothetical protein
MILEAILEAKISLASKTLLFLSFQIPHQNIKKSQVFFFLLLSPPPVIWTSIHKDQLIVALGYKSAAGTVE